MVGGLSSAEASEQFNISAGFILFLIVYSYSIFSHVVLVFSLVLITMTPNKYLLHNVIKSCIGHL